MALNVYLDIIGPDLRLYGRIEETIGDSNY